MIKAIIIVTLIASFLVGGLMAGILILIKWIIEGKATVNRKENRKNG